MKLYSRIYGSGPATLVLHGLFGMNDNWTTLAKKWAEDCEREMHVLDLRNHGRSPHDPIHNYQVMTADVLEYMNDHDLDEAAVLGHSMGGKVAMEMAVTHPGRVERLIVVDIAPKEYPVHHQDLIEALKTLDFDQITGRREADQALKPHIPHPGVRQFLLKSLYWVDDNRLALRYNLAAIEANLDSVGTPMDEDARYDGATLFIRGSESGYIRDSDKDRLVHHFPASTLHTVEGAGHWVHAEKPEEMYRVVCDFLNG